MRCQWGVPATSNRAGSWLTAGVAVCLAAAVSGCGGTAVRRGEPLVGEGAPAPTTTMAVAAPSGRATTPPSPGSTAVALPAPQPAGRAEDAARRFVTEYVSFSWREPQGAAARRAAAYATPTFGRELIAGTRPYAGWAAVVDGQEEARGVVEAAYRDADASAGTEASVTLLVRVELRSTTSSTVSRRAMAVRVAPSDGGWLVAGIEQ